MKKRVSPLVYSK